MNKKKNIHWREIEIGQTKSIFFLEFSGNLLYFTITLNRKRGLFGKLVNDGLPWIHLYKLQLK